MLLEKFFSMLFYNSKFAEKSNQKGDTAIKQIILVLTTPTADSKNRFAELTG